jgi:signal transduction histidine kinase
MAAPQSSRSSTRSRARRAALPVIILVAGLICTALAALQLQRSAEKAEGERFANLVEDRAAAITERFDTYMALLRGTSGLFAASGDVTREEFAAYVARLRIPEIYPGLQGVGFATIVAPPQVENFTAKLRETVPDFAIKPPGPRDFYTTIIYLEPRELRNQSALGYDMFTEPVRRQAMEISRDTGLRTASGKIMLLPEGAKAPQPGFAIYVPVYNTPGGAVPVDLEGRRAAISGWLYSPFRAQELFTKGLGLHGNGPLDFEVYDATDADPSNLLFRSNAGGSLSGRYRDTRTIDVIGRTWVMRAASTERFAQDANRRFVPFVIGGGLLTTLLLFAAALAQARATGVAQEAREQLRLANAGLEDRVEERTSQLESARNALETLNRNLETRVSIRTADLQEANEEMQRFAYIVSHDLRSPLVNVMGFTSELDVALQALRKFYEDAVARTPDIASPDAKIAIEEDLPEAIDFIRSSTSKMDRLINAILKLSREGRRVLTPEAIDLGMLMESIRKSLKHQIGEAGADIEVADLPEITSDRVALEQIFSNLIENAVKYLAPGRPGQIKVRGWSEGTTIVIDVEDNGRGIDLRDHSRVFDLFRRAGAQDRPGEGIGLAHVRALVRRLGGTITLTSEEGQGSTFRVRLPKMLTRNEGNA